MFVLRSLRGHFVDSLPVLRVLVLLVLKVAGLRVGLVALSFLHGRIGQVALAAWLRHIVVSHYGLSRLKVLSDPLVYSGFAQLIVVFGRLHLDHVFHSHLASDKLLLALVLLVNVDTRIASFRVLNGSLVQGLSSVSLSLVASSDDVHTVLLQTRAFSQVALADSIASLLGSGRLHVLAWLDVGLAQNVSILLS